MDTLFLFIKSCGKSKVLGDFVQNDFSIDLGLTGNVELENLSLKTNLIPATLPIQLKASLSFFLKKEGGKGDLLPHSNFIIVFDRVDT